MNKRTVLITIGLLALVVAVLAIAQNQLASAATEDASSRAAVSAFAQDDDAEDGFVPERLTFATIDLSAGFILDPYLVRVFGGGLNAAADLNEDCAGFVGATPNAAINWSGESDALHVFVYSDSDPVLVIETPDGDFLCSDDASALVLDPLVTIEEPAEGLYNVYVGSAELGDFHTGFLVMTELEADLGSLDLTPVLDRRDAPIVDPAAATDLSDLQFDLSAIFGSVELEAGFDTVEAVVAGGGALPVHNLPSVDEACVGFASIVPSYSFTWSGSGSGLTVFLEAAQDASLIILTPERELLCNDNVDSDNLNPSIDIAVPVAGEYDVFIGADVPNEVVAGKLTISAEAGATPDALAPADQ
jgi:serine protease Do